MLTDAKIEANRNNAQASTGPRTEEGKAASSRNALKHGLTAHTTLLSTENQADLDVFADGVKKDLNPLNTIEEDLVAQIIDCQWRLRRVGVYEARCLEADPPDFKSLTAMSLHAARIKHQFSASLKEFQLLHAQTNASITDQLQRAEVIHKADLLLDRPSTLADHGFVFSLPYLERWLARKNAVALAEKTIFNDKYGYGPEDEDEDELGDEEDLDQAA